MRSFSKLEQAGRRKAGRPQEVTDRHQSAREAAQAALVVSAGMTDGNQEETLKEEIVFTELNPPERKRTYVYDGGGEITIENVARVCVRPSGTVRLETTDGQKWIVLPGFRAVRLDMDAWTF